MFAFRLLYKLKGIPPHYYMNQSISEQENYRPELGWGEVKQRQS